MSENINLKIVVEDGVEVPRYATPGSAGMDLRIKEDVWLNPHERKTVGTGVRMAIPEGYVGLVFPRSGLASKMGISLSNCVGVIDSDYRGEVGATLVNNDVAPHFLQRGERVCQLAVIEVAHCDVSVVDELDETERGEGGFGSTGTK